ncbi:MAG: hypothetical protein NZM11_06380 [Anaerolineales bacterium]|nr:hypothetical protein [Anaerolineales bacterium]
MQPDLPIDQADATAARAATSTPAPRELARIVLFVFLATFIVSRVLVFLIMAQKLPDLYLYVGGTHVHHLNHGIFLLVGVGAWLLLQPPRDRRWAAALYGVGLALTFDEFGMWLHLGGGYWQRASWDAIVVVAAGLSWLAFGPAPAQYRSRHWLAALVLSAVTLLFFWMLAQSLDYAGTRVLPKFQRIEDASPH